MRPFGKRKKKIVKDFEKIQNEESFWKGAVGDLKTIEKVIGDIMEMKAIKQHQPSTSPAFGTVLDGEYKEILGQLNNLLEQKNQTEFIKVINETKERLLNEVEELSKVEV